MAAAMQPGLADWAGNLAHSGIIGPIHHFWISDSVSHCSSQPLQVNPITIANSAARTLTIPSAPVPLASEAPDVMNE
jgi:hypothetical protein